MQARGQNGFLLVETLPALLLVVAVLLVSLNIERIRNRLIGGENTERACVMAFPYVSSEWLENPGSKAALCTLTDEAGWKVIVFPDENWLPLHPGTEGRTLIWRRFAGENDFERGLWKVEVFHPRLSKWRWWINYYDRELLSEQ